MNSNVRPLDGILVVSIEQAVAAPYCTRLLADQGARVLKVEREEGGDFARAYDRRVEGEASYFVWANRSKESICLDLKKPEDLDFLWKMLEKADVFLQNLAPGAAERLGLAKAAFSERAPKLVSCSISGFGPGGPYGSRKAYDLLVQAEAGFLSITGTEDVPCKAGISIADICAGVTAYHLILAALIKRGKTGKGDHIEVSMLESLVEWMGTPLYYAYDGAPPPTRAGASHATIYPYGPYRTQDGTVLFGLQNDREWTAFCAKVLLKEEWSNDPRFHGNAGRAEHRDEIDEVIHAVLSHLTTSEVSARLEAGNIAIAEVRDMASVWSHPQLKHRDRWGRVQIPSGASSANTVAALIPPAADSWSPKMEPVPALGEHTDAVRAEFFKAK